MYYRVFLYAPNLLDDYNTTSLDEMNSAIALSLECQVCSILAASSNPAASLAALYPNRYSKAYERKPSKLCKRVVGLEYKGSNSLFYIRFCEDCLKFYNPKVAMNRDKDVIDRVLYMRSVIAPGSNLQ